LGFALKSGLVIGLRNDHIIWHDACGRCEIECEIVVWITERAVLDMKNAVGVQNPTSTIFLTQTLYSLNHSTSFSSFPLPHSPPFPFKTPIHPLPMPSYHPRSRAVPFSSPFSFPFSSRSTIHLFNSPAENMQVVWVGAKI